MLDVFISEIINHRLDHFNALEALTQIENKIFQLRAANKSGLRIPNTIITNLKSDVVRFMEVNSYEYIIAKPPCMGFLPPAMDGSPVESILANRVAISQILSMNDRLFGEVPFIYQEEIEKLFELRVVCTRIGCAAFKIDTQNSELGEVDSRRATFEKIYSETSLDPKIFEKLRRYLRECNLQYGVFDLAVSRDGEETFFECNPDGQWAWLEQATGSTKARDVMAEMLEYLLS